MTNIRRFDHKGKKCFTIMGVDYGGPLEIIEESTWGILAKIPGSMVWIGIGITKYMGPQFVIFEKGPLPETFADYSRPIWENRYDKKTRQLKLLIGMDIFQAFNKTKEAGK